MDCGAKTAKFLLFIFNLLFFISGIALLVVGAVVKSGEPTSSEFYDSGIYSVSILLVVVGVIITLIAFFGCCGAIRESRCMLNTFAVILVIIFILEISGGIAAYVYRGQIDTHMKNTMDSSLSTCRNSSNFTAPECSSWSSTQEELECCGVNSYQDWLVAPGTTVPQQCCKDPSKCNTNGSKPEDYYNQGCWNALKQELEDDMYLIGGVAIGFAFIEILGIVLSCCVRSNLKYV